MKWKKRSDAFFKISPKEKYKVDKTLKMSLVHDFPIPEVLWYDWAVIFAGLGIGVGSIFEIINLSGPDTKKLYTWTNFWLILSGVIHVLFYKCNINYFH